MRSPSTHDVRAFPFLALALALAVATAGPASADWLPLTIGNTWHYTDDLGVPHDEVITDFGHVRGRRMYVKTYIGGEDDGLLNFWQLGPDGSVLLGGYYRPAFPFGLVYEPPVKVFPGQPAVGQTWQTHTIAYSIPDDAFYAEFDLYWRVDSQLSIGVPAGIFPCFGSGQVAPPAASAVVQGHALSVDGRLLGTASTSLEEGPSSATDWYSDGVGLVQYDTGVLYVLESFEVTVPTMTTTWGRIKQLYR